MEMSSNSRNLMGKSQAALFVCKCVYAVSCFPEKWKPTPPFSKRSTERMILCDHVFVSVPKADIVLSYCYFSSSLTVPKIGLPLLFILKVCLVLCNALKQFNSFLHPSINQSFSFKSSVTSNTLPPSTYRKQRNHLVCQNCICLTNNLTSHLLFVPPTPLQTLPFFSSPSSTLLSASQREPPSSTQSSTQEEQSRSHFFAGD